MNLFEKILYSLQKTMERPTLFGWFHFLCIGMTILLIVVSYKIKDNHSEKQLKIILAIYGITAFVLELLKQLMWSLEYNEVTQIVTWDYQWYSFPFQLCTTPIYVSLIALFLKNNKVRKALLSYLSFITILGGIATIIFPESCFSSDILINIHTMWLHCGSLVVSIYLLMSKEIEININNLLKAIMIFLIFVIIAQFLNIIIYNIGVLNGETFNMFFISPYFISTLPVFDIVQQNTPYIIFILFYIFIISFGGLIIYFSSLYIKKLTNKKELRKRN